MSEKIKNKILSVFMTEGLGLGKGATDIQQGDSKPIESADSSKKDYKWESKKDNAKRKQIDRQGENRIKKIENRRKEEEKASKEGVKLDPRKYLEGHFKLSLKETFAHHLIKYLDNGEWSELKEALSLMEDYPALEKYVTETSRKYLPTNNFSVYATRQHFDEEVGTPINRSGNEPFIWSLSHDAASDYSKLEEAVIIEAKISPDKVLINVEAFNKLMEELIFSQKIEEPSKNVLREARRRKIVIVPNSVNEGTVIGYKGI